MANEKLHILLHLLATTSPLDIFADLTFVAKVAVFVVAIAAICGTVVFIRRDIGIYSKALATCGRTGLAASAFGAVYSGVNAYLGLVGSSNPYQFNEVAQAIIIVAYVLVPGLIVWFFARLSNVGVRRASPTPD
ncbi:hypothetical protein AEAC466_14015 [Asticcacaulis sp. AC466]|uniref:hypothetical protein n=1 Tax=Asticcacaulis sp. AC466 TaxID=1282362 RepID=UPI0003C3CE11|nr:hypothetical protein [Asticcacaulis sp. AC466]ESQ83360.1 hypothetical protein AEAC466_14015 [Asticcacaulis sp. AC466]